MQIAGEVFQLRIVRVQVLCEVPEGSDVFNSTSILFGQKHLNAVYDAFIYL